MQLLPLLKGLATFVPGIYDARRGNTGGSVTARYCYGTWLRLLRTLHDACGPVVIRRAAELGPGDSIGIGLAAMLSGVDHVESLDIVRYASVPRNREIFRELVQLFRSRAPIPDAAEFPGLQPRLADYGFPHDLLPGELLESALNDQRVAAIESAIGGAPSNVSIEYRVPWNTRDVQPGRDVDLVYSQAVLEHVEDLEGTHRALGEFVREGGVAVHAIDLRSHRITPGWDGHLQYSPALWRLVKGRRPYLLNRKSPGEHLSAMEAAGFQILEQIRIFAEPTVPVGARAASFRNWSEEDRRTTSMTVVARRTSARRG
jgi:hypothetical protein